MSLPFVVINQFNIAGIGVFHFGKLVVKFKLTRIAKPYIKYSKYNRDCQDGKLILIHAEFFKYKAQTLRFILVIIIRQ